MGLYNAYELTSPGPKVDERWIVARSVYVKGFHNEGLLRSEGFEWKQKKREAEQAGGGGGGGVVVRRRGREKILKKA